MSKDNSKSAKNRTLLSQLNSKEERVPLVHQSPLLVSQCVVEIRVSGGSGCCTVTAVLLGIHH